MAVLKLSSWYELQKFMPWQSLHIPETKLNDNGRVWFMKNAYPMNQFEFIEQKLQNCGLVRNQASP